MIEAYLKDIRYAAALSTLITLSFIPFLFMPLSLYYVQKHYQTIQDSKPLMVDLRHSQAPSQPETPLSMTTQSTLPQPQPQDAPQKQPVPAQQAMIPPAHTAPLPKHKRSINILEVPAQATVDQTQNLPADKKNSDHAPLLEEGHPNSALMHDETCEPDGQENSAGNLENWGGHCYHQANQNTYIARQTGLGDHPRANKNRWFSKQAQQKKAQDEIEQQAQKAFAKAVTHARYRALTLTKVGAQSGLISQDLSSLPDTIEQASAAEIQIFAEKVHYTLARYLDEHNFFVYSPVRTDAPINFELIAQNGRIVAFVITRSSNNPEFDRALGKVVEDMSNDLITPISKQPVAFPFTYTIHFEPGLLRYHISRSNFCGN